MVSSDISVEREAEGLAVVTLDRPAKRNAISLSMWQSLKSIFHELGKTDEVRAVVLTGAGANFSAGADIGEFAIVRADARSGAIYERAEEEALLAVLHCNKPTIAQISGFAVGGACALACACDFRIADRSATFFIPAARLGIVYSLLETELLLRQVGLANAKHILFSGERITGDKALRIGLLTELVEAEVEHATRQFASGFAANAPISLAGNKAILNALARGEANQRRADLEAWIHRSMESDDYKEGQRAFREKRPPRFSGR